MKKISLSALAILLAAATLFAEGTEMIKNQPKKAKQECHNQNGTIFHIGKYVFY